MTYTPPARQARAWLARCAGPALAACALTCGAIPTPAAPVSAAATTAPAPVTATATATAPAPRPLPWDARAEVLQQVWRPVLGGTVPATDAPRTPWREANDTVGRIGGWRSYAREAATAARTTAPTPASAATPSPAPAPGPTPHHPGM